MTIHLAGSTSCIFGPLLSGVSETASNVDTAWVDTGINFGNTNSLAQTVAFASLSEGYIHFECFLTDPTNWTRDLLVAQDATGQDRFRLEDQRLRIWDGSAFQSRGDTIATQSGRVRWDVYFRSGASGEITVWRNEEVVATWSGDTGTFAINRLFFGNPVAFGSQSAVISQVLVADFLTLRSKVSSRRPDSNGTYTAWTGDVTALDEAVTDFADAILTTSTSDRESFTCSARSLTGYEARGVGVNFMGYRSGASAPKVRPFLRRSGADYDGDDVTLSFGRSRHSQMWEEDPATLSPWTAANAGSAALEFGVQGRP